MQKLGSAVAAVRASKVLQLGYGVAVGRTATLHVLWHAGVQQAGDADRQNKHMMHVRQRGKHMHVMPVCTADLPSEVENWYAHSVLR